MEDQNILNHIRKLVDEEQRLENRLGSGAPDEARLARLNTELDQCWDLLRQRRARREYGENPNEADVRSADTVEHYDPNARVTPDD